MVKHPKNQPNNDKKNPNLIKNKNSQGDGLRQNTFKEVKKVWSAMQAFVEPLGRAGLSQSQLKLHLN